MFDVEIGAKRFVFDLATAGALPDDSGLKVCLSLSERALEVEVYVFSGSSGI